MDIQQQIQQGVSILKQGGIVAYPTDTVYGLGACINIRQAVERIYQVKNRPRSMALPLLLADRLQINEVARSVSPLAWQLVDKFLPGALTIILHKSESVPGIVTADGATVAIRIPDHPVPVALIRGLAAPLVGTSANLSGCPSPLTATEVSAQFGDRIDFIIDGGTSSGGRESTIVDLTGGTPVILRRGAISREELEQVCGNVISGEGG